MKSAWMWPVAVIGAVAVGWLLAGRETPASTAPAPIVNVDALEARVAGLEAKVADLQGQLDDAPRPAVARAEVAPAVDGPRPARVARAEAPGAVEVPREAVVDAITGNDREVRKHLRKMIASERDAEREARWERRQERAIERTRQMVADLADAADLDDDERETVQTKLNEERTVIMGLFKAAREDGSWREAHREAQDVRGATDEAMKASLGQNEYEQYKAMREEDGWGRRGRH